MFEQSKSAFPKKLAGAIWSRATRVDGRKEAFEYVLQVDGDVEQVTDRLRDEEEYLKRRLTAGAREMQPGAGPRVYLDGYVAGLRDALGLLPSMKGPDASQAASRLQEALRTIRKETVLAQAKEDALQFASKSQGDLTALLNELSRAKNEIPASEAGANVATRPEPTDPVYREAYLAGIREAIELVTQMTGQQPPATE